jgi:hypothetical protein
MKQMAYAHAVCLVVVTATSSPAIADQTCKPVEGHFLASVVPPGTGHCPPTPGTLCTAGRVWGGIQGNYQFVMTGVVPSITVGGVPTILFFTGQSRIALQSGDQLNGTDTGSIDLPPGQGGFASLITFSGGTGAMNGATGQIRLRGEFSASAGTTSGDYIGSVCTQ